MKKTLIKNGIIVDGTGKKGYRSDIVIIDDLIKQIKTTQGEENYFHEVIDAGGKIVCPGFIDTHSHSDLQVLINPVIEPKLRQGITTEILGQDGISAAPLPLKYVANWRKNISGLDGDSESLSWDWENTEGYLKLIEKNKATMNTAYLVPHGNIRMEAMGLDSRKADIYEIEKMKTIVEREFEAGAVGLSSGLIYMPCAYGDTTELIELCKVAAKHEKPFVVHQRSEADTILESMEEIIKIGMESNVKIHFSHFKICGKKNWSKMSKVLQLLDKAAYNGIDISFDQYPYTAGSTMLGVILPPWVHDGGTENLLLRLKDSNLRKKMIMDIESGIPGWDNFIDFAGFDNIYVTSVVTEDNKALIGKNLSEIAEIKGKNPYDSVFDLLYEEKNAVGMYDYYGKEEQIVEFMKRKEQNVCTDGLLGGKPHPRVYGSFPRVLGKYVREMGVLSLEEAVYKMTKKAASVFNLKDRGEIKPEKKADILIFDKDTIKDRATFLDPCQYSSGIETVIVNGKVALNKATIGEITAGDVIRI